MDTVDMVRRPHLTGLTAIVLAAGQGVRFGGAPKVWRRWRGRPLWWWSLDAFWRAGAEALVLVVAPDRVPDAEALAREAPWPFRVAPGGATRALSSQNGLARAETPYVAIHDAARPLVTPALIERVYQAAVEVGAAIPGREPPDTVKFVRDGRVRTTVPREHLVLVETPQVFRRDWIAAAVAVGSPTVTDDSAWLEALGRPVAVVPGDPHNRKITTREDWVWLARQEETGNTMRVGYGFDIHPFQADRPLVLAGVTIPDHPGLAGDSDGDPVLHAVLDACLGARGLGDLGQAIPRESVTPGTPSRMLWARVWPDIVAGGWRVVNVDATIVTETPRLQGWRAAMVAELRRLTGAAAVSVKFKGADGLGAIGARQGIAAHAVVLMAGPDDPEAERERRDSPD